ncbi:MAG: hypothetical protein V4674_00160 [Patescibacteria group bacterium]
MEGQDRGRPSNEEFVLELLRVNGGSLPLVRISRALSAENRIGRRRGVDTSDLVSELLKQGLVRMRGQDEYVEIVRKEEQATA